MKSKLYRVSKTCLIVLTTLFAGWAGRMWGQSPLCFSLETPRVQGNTDEIIVLPVRVLDFQEMVSVQLGFTWNPGALQFQQLQFPGNNPLGLSAANFNANQSGQLRFAWYDSNGLGVNLPDSTVLFAIVLKVLNPTPGFYPLELQNLFLFPNEAVSFNGGVLSIAYQTGGVFVNTALQPGLYLQNLCAANGSIAYDLQTGTPPYSFNWTGPNGFTSTDQNLNGLANGIYYLDASDNAGATASAIIFVGNQDAPISLTYQVHHTSCAQNDGCIDLTVSAAPPVSFQWSNLANSEDICNLLPGDYFVTIIDGIGNSRVDSFVVESRNELEVNVFASPGNCLNNQYGSAAAIPYNGVGPYTYVWSNSASGAAISGLFAGWYYVTVTDNAGCTGTGEAYVSNGPVDAWGMSLTPVCPGTLLVRADDPGGIHFPMTLYWSNGTNTVVPAASGDTLDVLIGAPQGFYSVIAVDSLGCSDYLETTLNCLGPPPADSAALVWPGDADNNNAVNHHDLLYLGLAFGASGPARPGASLDWSGQQAPDWSQVMPFNGVNFKNIDTNGDGLIDAADTLAIVNNWAKVINPQTDDPFAAAQTAPGSLPTPAPVLSFVADTLPAGQVVSVPVMLGSAGAPADSLHGISFSFSYNPNVLQALYFLPSASWLGDPASGLLCLQHHFPGQHRLDIALTRTDGMPAGGYGEIGRTFIVIEDDIFFKQSDLEIEWAAGGGSGAVHTTLFLRNVHAMTPSNTRLEIAQQSTPVVVVKDVGVGATEAWASAVRLSPNPVSETLRVESPDNPLQSIRVTDMAGRPFWYRQCEDTAFQEIPVSGWPRGVYIAELQTGQGRCFKKFICQ